MMEHSTRMALLRYSSTRLFMSFISELVTMMTCGAGRSRYPCYRPATDQKLHAVPYVPQSGGNHDTLQARIAEHLCTQA